MLFSAQHCPVPQAQANAQIASFKEISLQYSYEELSVATMLGWMGYVGYVASCYAFRIVSISAFRKNWSDSERLGSGSYGSVFKA